MFGGGSNNLEKQLFNLRFTAKSLQREAVKCEKAEKAEKAKIKKAMEKGNIEGARIHAENSIRQKNQALNYMRLASRIDGVASRVQTAVATKSLTKSMTGVVKSMDKAMSGVSLEKMSMVMDKFENQFESLDVQTQYMENAMGNSVVQTIPQDQVSDLMHQVADEHNLEMNMELDQTKVPVGAQTQEENDLTDRLAKLRQQS
eukprot:Clim_evm110s149 gene=Clim_evmTU110s149